MKPSRLGMLFPAVLFAVLTGCSGKAPNTGLPLNGPLSSGYCPARLPTGRELCFPGASCAYGSETCCGQTYATMECTCGSDGAFSCGYTDACLRPESSCNPPIDAGQPGCPESHGDSASCTPGLTCTYGTETCCGQTYPSLVCTCNAAGEEACHNTDACFRRDCGPLDGGSSVDAGLVIDAGIAIDAGMPPCPATHSFRATCTPGQTCTYGTETCCGQTYPSLVCTCNAAGEEACHNTDACFRPPNSCPGADGGQS